MRRKLTANRFLEVGAVTGFHGLKGALTIFSHTRPAIGIAGYSFWWVGDSPETAISYKVNRCWQHGGGKKLLAQLDGVDDCTAAEALKKSAIWVDASEVAVDEDEYLWDDLQGFKVITTGGLLLGRVEGLLEFGAQDNLCVVTAADAEDSGEWLLPFIEEVVLSIDDENKIITIEMLEGMDACFTPKS